MLEYRRVMCNLMWRSLIEKQPDTFDFIAWEEINDVRDVTVPEVGKVHTGMEDFAVFARRISAAVRNRAF